MRLSQVYQKVSEFYMNMLSSRVCTFGIVNCLFIAFMYDVCRV